MVFLNEKLADKGLKLILTNFAEDCLSESFQIILSHKLSNGSSINFKTFVITMLIEHM